MENVWKDIRFGLRTLVRNPSTTLLAMLTLALALVANWVPALRATRVDPLEALRYE